MVSSDTETFARHPVASIINHTSRRTMPIIPPPLPIPGIVGPVKKVSEAQRTNISTTRCCSSIDCIERKVKSRSNPFLDQIRGTFKHNFSTSSIRLLIASHRRLIHAAPSLPALLSYINPVTPRSGITNGAVLILLIPHLSPGLNIGKNLTRNQRPNCSLSPVRPW